MRKRICVIGCLLVLFCILLAGCGDRDISIPEKQLENVEHTGQVSAEFADIVENNLFYEITAFEDRLLKTEICSWDEENHTMEQRVWMMDLYGKELASYTCTTDDAYHVTTLTATDDGGFLFVLGFRNYVYGDGQWASEKGVASRVIKCDSDGNVQFDTPFVDVEERALRFCLCAGLRLLPESGSLQEGAALLGSGGGGHCQRFCL